MDDSSGGANKAVGASRMEQQEKHLQTSSSSSLHSIPLPLPTTTTRGAPSTPSPTIPTTSWSPSYRSLSIIAVIVIVGTSYFASVRSAQLMNSLFKTLREDGVENDYGYNNSPAAASTNRAPAASKNNDSSSSYQDADAQEDRTSKQRQDAPNVNKEVKDMNIVLFYADDWTWRTIGAINKIVQTPNIDNMAKRGMLFTHNCVTTSICWQSRATLVTGLYVAVHQHVKIGSEEMFNKTVQWPQTLYPLLKEHGYHVGYYGKWHAPMPDSFQKYTFDEFDNYYGDHWLERGGKLRHVTALNEEDALVYLREKRPKNQKFALTVSFFATHSCDGNPYPDQYMPQNYTQHMYANETIPEPKTATLKHWNDMPWFFTDENEARTRWRQRYNTPERFQHTMKKIYRMATEVDDVVGNVIEELKAQGVYNNTLLVFTTDNGMFHGEHQMAGKWYPHEESLRVPLIIQDPRMPLNVRGTWNDDFTLNIDLAPTLLSAAGIPVPPHMQGRDIADLYLMNNNNNNNNAGGEASESSSSSSPSWRKDFFYEWTQGSPVDATGHNVYTHIPAVFALIRKDYKYFYWPQVKYEQVFHIAKDPYEEMDIFNETTESDSQILAELRGRYAYLKSLSQSGHPV